MLKMGYRHQRTLARPAVISGPGLVTGAPVQVKLHPAPENTGVVFVRSDRPGYPVIPARAEWVTSTQRRTTLGGGESARRISVETSQRDRDELFGQIGSVLLRGVDGQREDTRHRLGR